MAAKKRAALELASDVEMELYAISRSRTESFGRVELRDEARQRNPSQRVRRHEKLTPWRHEN